MSAPFLPTAAKRIAFGVWSSITHYCLMFALLVWDTALVFINFIMPDRPLGKVVLKGDVGHGGMWPDYMPAGDGDSRCSCPALNAMANHGILPHNGKNIKFTELGDTIRRTYNFSPTFCFYVPHYAANYLGRNYWSDTFDLSDIDVHNCIEHDASLTRFDSHYSSDQSKKDMDAIEEVLRAGTGPGGDLTPADVARLLGKRRVEAKQRNPQFSMAFIHRIFGSSNASTMVTIFGGKIKDLRSFLVEERIPQGWESRITHQMGLTMAEFQKTVLRVELGIKEEVDGSLAAARCMPTKAKKQM